MKEYKHISYEIIEPFLVKVGSAISTSQAKNLLKALGNAKSRKAYKNTLAKQEGFLTDLKYLSRENPAALRQQGININQNELNQMLDSVQEQRRVINNFDSEIKRIRKESAPSLRDKGAFMSSQKAQSEAQAARGKSRIPFIQALRENQALRDRSFSAGSGMSRRSPYFDYGKRYSARDLPLRQRLGRLVGTERRTVPEILDAEARQAYQRRVGRSQNFGDTLSDQEVRQMVPNLEDRANLRRPVNPEELPLQDRLNMSASELIDMENEFRAMAQRPEFRNLGRDIDSMRARYGNQVDQMVSTTTPLSNRRMAEMDTRTAPPVTGARQDTSLPMISLDSMLATNTGRSMPSVPPPAEPTFVTDLRSRGVKRDLRRGTAGTKARDQDTFMPAGSYTPSRAEATVPSAFMDDVTANVPLRSEPTQRLDIFEKTTPSFGEATQKGGINPKFSFSGNIAKSTNPIPEGFKGPRIKGKM